MSKGLNCLSKEELSLLFPIVIVEADPRWRNSFYEEKELLEKNFGNDYFLTIEHIGSTAIPGICSKPTIDILCQIRNNADINYLKKQFINLQYSINDRPDKPPPHLTFVKGYTQEGVKGQTFHVHIRYAGDWDEICFRDYLIKNRDTALEYEILKKRLAIQFKYDREGYTEAKSDFINQTVATARKLPT